MSTHTLKVTRHGFRQNASWENEYEIKFEYSPGRPMQMYSRNGDPGTPEEPASIDLIACKVDGHTAFDHEETWAIDFLAENMDLVEEQVDKDSVNPSCG